MCISRQDDDLWQKLKAYENLLLKFAPLVDDDDQQDIQDAILMVLYQKSEGKTLNNPFYLVTTSRRCPKRLQRDGQG